MPKKSSSCVRIFSPRYSREEILDLLRERLRLLDDKLNLRLVALFGSYGRGTHTAFSDIDLLVVYADPARSDAFSLVKKTLNLRGLEPHVLAESDYQAVKSIWEKMTREGVELWPE